MKSGLILVFILFNLTFSNTCFGQFYEKQIEEKSDSPYKIKKTRTVINTGVGLAGLIAGQSLKGSLDPLSLQDINSLDSDGIPFFDQGAISNYSLKARDWSDYIRYGSFSLPLLLLLDDTASSNWQQILIIGTESYLFNWGLTTISKSTFKRTRPLAYNNNVPLEEQLTVDARLSFFSGHTSDTALFTFLTAKFFSDFYPDSPYKPYVWGGAALATITTGYLRYRGGKHFFSDVLTGGIVGGLVGILVPQSHKIKRVKGNDLSIRFVGNSGSAGLFVTF